MAVSLRAQCENDVPDSHIQKPPAPRRQGVLAQHGKLRLIEYQHIAAGKVFTDHHMHRGGIQNHIHPPAPGRFHGVPDDLNGVFQLAQENISLPGPFQKPVGILGHYPAVGPSVQNDAVIALRHKNDGDAAGAIRNHPNRAGVHAAALQPLHKGFAKAVRAHGSAHVGFGSQPAAGNGLICALSAGIGEKAGPIHGFSRLGKAGAVDDQIHIEAAKYKHFLHHLISCAFRAMRQVYSASSRMLVSRMPRI